MSTHLPMQCEGLTTTSTTSLHGGGFLFPLWSLGMPHDSGVLVPDAKLLMIHSTSSTGVV